MISLSSLVGLTLVFAPAPAALSPEAAEHNARAMGFYDASRLDLAIDEFHAAYLAMPDARRDRAGRELMLGAMHGTLRALFTASGDPAPLCRLRDLLQGHAEALEAAFPDSPEMPEVRSVRARHRQVSRDLAELGPDSCEPPPPLLAAPSPRAPVELPLSTTRERRPEPLTTDRDPLAARRLRLSGGITLGLGVALLGATVYGIADEASQSARARAIDLQAEGRPLTTKEHRELLDARADAHVDRRISVCAGIAAGVTAAVGTMLVVLGRRAARGKRWSAAPWWSTTGAGLLVRLPLGAARRPV